MKTIKHPVRCHLKAYNEDWDKKLHQLITEGEVIGLEKCTIVIRLTTKTFKQTWLDKLLRRTRSITKDFHVWTSNKPCAYGYLYRINGETVSEAFEYSASQETLNKLYELEMNTVHGKFTDILEINND